MDDRGRLQASIARRRIQVKQLTCHSIWISSVKRRRGSNTRLDARLSKAEGRYIGELSGVSAPSGGADLSRVLPILWGKVLPRGPKP